MKFFNLHGSPHKSANVLLFRNTYILFDCPLDLMPCLGFMPLSVVHNPQLSSLPNWRLPKDKLAEADVGLNFKETRQLYNEVKECHANYNAIDSPPEFATIATDIVDLKRIDVVLISNYLNMLALPFLTERFKCTAVIYVTEPTYHFGRIMMEELIMLIERTPKPRCKSHLWKKVSHLISLPIPKLHKMNADPNSWSQIYTMSELNSCMSKLKVVSFSQFVDVFGLFDISAHSSGFCIGSCNWVLKSRHEKIVYMSQNSLLTTHPKPIDPLPLQNADILVMTNLTPSPLINPDTMLGEFCLNTMQALKQGGNVLVPCYPCGVVYDLIECIAGQLTAANLSHVTIYFLSPVADSSLAYSNILGEWLTTSKQAKLYEPDEPFIHASLVRAGRLKHFSGVSDPSFNEAFKTPCVIFTSHPSLRFGDVVHFIQLWQNSSRNLLILTEPDFPWQEAVNPYLPMPMRILFIPIDTNWNFKQANNLINNELKPSNLILSEEYTKLPAYLNNHNFATTDLMVEIQTKDVIAQVDTTTTPMVGKQTTPTSVVSVVSNPVAAASAASAGIQVPSQTQIQKLTPPAASKPKIADLHSYSYLGSVILEDFEVPYERVYIESSLASTILQSEIRPGVSFATINGTLFAKDNKFSLLSLQDKKPRNVLKPNVPLIKPPKQNYYGNINITMLLEIFVKNGMVVATVESSRTGKIINLQSPMAIVHLEESETNIIAPDNKTRAKLLEIISSCLKKF